MATPKTAGQFADALRAEGLTVRERSGWATHNRNSMGAWGPLNGVMIHHTVSGDGAGIVDLCYDGRADLPGPLCHGVIHKDGSVTLVGWGRANHAGFGDQAALTAVINESAVHPKPGEGTVDGNARFVGFECVNWGDGDDPWPEVQLDAIARGAAAVCRQYGWSADSVIGHLEWTNQKIDPKGFGMGSMRSRIANRLAHPAGWNPGTTTEEDDMPTPQEYAEAVWNHRLTSPTAAKGTDQTRPAGVFLSYGDAHHAQLIALIGAQNAAIAALAKGGGLDAVEIQTAAAAGAEAALDRLGIALTEGS